MLCAVRIRAGRAGRLCAVISVGERGIGRRLCTGIAHTLVTLTLIEVRRQRAAADTRGPVLGAPVGTATPGAPRAGAAP